MSARRGTILLLALSLLVSASLVAQTRKENIDLLVSGGTIVTLDATRILLEGSAVAVNGDTILSVGPSAELAAKYSAALRIDGKGKLVLPGFIDGHTHVPNTLFHSVSRPTRGRHCQRTPIRQFRKLKRSRPLQVRRNLSSRSFQRTSKMPR
jgi:predicted amidohydrolase YtcJ